MAGLYIHIPFCKQACHYCDFHFSTNQSKKGEMVEAICKEMKMQKKFLDEPIQTIYFGGGTPSLLNKNELELILKTARDNFEIDIKPEITLEANPDDLNTSNLSNFYKSGINRLSIGIQTFNESQLTFLNRAHNASEALDCIKNARTVGFENISIDLIYGIPSVDHQIWNRDLDLALEISPQHISSYCLTIEPKTAFGNWLKKGDMPPIDEEYASTQFEILIKRLTKSGYEHYEVSNFGLPKRHSLHNTAYWLHKPYLGIGPGAHSFNGIQRQYNISNNSKYLLSISQNKIPFDAEVLSAKDISNEYIMMTLRTQWGCDLKYLLRNFNYDCMAVHKKYIEELVSTERAFISNERLILTSAGKLLADGIALNLFQS